METVRSGDTSDGTLQYHFLADDDGGAAGEPPDRWGLTYLLMFLFGITTLIFWNSIITPYDYFSLLYPTDFNFEEHFSVVYNISSFTTGMLMIWTGKWIPLSVKFLVSYSIILVLLVLLPILGYALASNAISPSLSSFLTSLVVFAGGIFSGVVYPSLAGVAAIFPPAYISSWSSGIGFAGLLAGVIRILTKVLLPGTPDGVRLGAALFFGVSAFFVVLALICFLLMKRLAFVKYHFALAAKPQPARAPSPALSPLHEGGSSVFDPESTSNPPTLNNIPQCGSEPPSGLAASFSVHSAAPVPPSHPPHQSAGSGGQVLLRALLGLLFFTTLALFPGVTSMVHSEDSWFQITFITNFLTCDWIGRSLPVLGVLFSARTIWMPVVARLIFCPAFVLCIHPALIASKAVQHLFMSLFALSNGYLCTLLFIHLADSCASDEERESSGPLTVVSLNVGLVMGVLLSSLIADLLR